MLRSSQHKLEPTNQGKREQLRWLVQQYRLLAQEILDDIWFNYPGFDPTTNQLDLPKYLDSSYLAKFETDLSARMKQCCGKQVLGMLRAATKKRSKQLWVLARQQRAGKEHEKLQRYIDIHPLTKPRCNRIQPTLDSRFVDFRETPDGQFDLFIRIWSIGSRQQIRIPVQHHKTSRKWLNRGKLKRMVRLSCDSVYLVYEAQDASKHPGKVVGCDQGYLTVATLSDWASYPAVSPWPRFQIHSYQAS